MKLEERASIFRIASDLIKSDAVIDVREINVLNQIRDRFSINKQDETTSANISLADAINTLKTSQANIIDDLWAYLKDICISDNNIAREEAILMLALKICLFENETIEGQVVSVDISDYYVAPNQILYVESRFDRDINWNINECFRTIVSEMMLAGFDFVYIPQIAEHYRALPDDELMNITHLLYPNSSEEKINNVIKQLKKLTTCDFCKGLLSGYFKFKDVSVLPPSIMLKVGDSYVNDKKTTNFLLIELNKDVMSTIRKFVDLFTSTYQTQSINCKRKGEGRFIYTGFYKQIFDLHMQSKCVQSSVVVDIFRNEIRFPEADIKLDKLHRREKALYTLFLIESASGGINFTKPSAPKQLEKYERRMSILQTKYNLIYRKFGGEIDSAPNIELSEIRLPMISLIKRQLKKLDGHILNIEDYTIQRNFYGNYAVNIPRDKCLCAGFERNDIRGFSEFTDWAQILAL